jgi:hypothetical protein
MADGRKRGNSASFSYFNIAPGETPLATILFSPEVRKNTLANVLVTGIFVVDVISDELRETIVASSYKYVSDVAEGRLLGRATIGSAGGEATPAQSSQGGSGVLACGGFLRADHAY